MRVARAKHPIVNFKRPGPVPTPDSTRPVANDRLKLSPVAEVAGRLKEAIARDTARTGWFTPADWYGFARQDLATMREALANLQADPRQAAAVATLERGIRRYEASAPSGEMRTDADLERMLATPWNQIAAQTYADLVAAQRALV